jgi:cephalosporin hydroxylase
MAGYLEEHGITNRKVIVADSFEGVPVSSLEQDAGLMLDKATFPELAVSVDEVKANFDAYGLLGEKVHFLPGWFGESLGAVPSERLALLRLDGDLYESTMDSLLALYDRVTPGGVVIIDDWGVVPPSRRAVEDFFAERNESLPEMAQIDLSGVWFRKPGGPPTLERTFRTGFPPQFLADYQSGTLRYTHRGRRCVKSPIDLAIYSRAIWDLRPATVIEIGSLEGGSALWLADLLRGYGFDAHIYSIDREPPTDVQDDRITFVRGDVHDLDGVLHDAGIADAPHPWFVTEDSAHTREACLIVLEAFHRHMAPGDLLVIEDGVLDELGLSDRYDGGPNRAISEYLTANPGVFKIRSDLCDMFGQNKTYAPNGYLSRQAP